MSAFNESCFVSAGLVERLVKFPDGTEHPIHFKRLLAADYQKFYFAQQSKDDNVRAQAMQKMVQASVCKPDGSLDMTLEQAMTIKPGFLVQLVEVITEVNDFSEAGKG